MPKGNVKRGDVFYADLSPVVGSEQGGRRPVLVVQNNIGNHFSPTVIVAAITAQIAKPKMPTHVRLAANQAGLDKDSVCLLEQVRTIDKKRLNRYQGHVSKKTMAKINAALEVSLGLTALDQPKPAGAHAKKRSTKTKGTN